jgi:GNAT superfamily N-acetyltransferase
VTSPDPHRIVRADLEEAATVLALAFADDPLWVAIAPEAPARARLLGRLYRLVLAPAVDAGRVIAIGRPVAGVAVWHLPGDARSGPRGLLDAAIAAASLLPSALSLARALRVQRTFAVMRQVHATGRIARLEHVGVLPAARGRGVASALIRPLLCRAEANGLPAWTETVTPGNVALYEHMGFKVVASAAVAPLGVTLWGLRREGPARGESDARDTLRTGR